MPRPVIIDSDGGVDDAAALWFALQAPELDVVAITTVWGNVGSPAAAANLGRILHAAGRPDIPVALGEDAPIGPAPDLGRPDWVHGADGLGDCGMTADPPPVTPVEERASDLLRRLVHERPGELSVLTLGPLSNLGRVLRQDPSWAAAVDELAVMGGSISRGGNATAAGEANIVHDPEAAAAVVAAPWARPPLLVGLDVTLVATLTASEFEALEEAATPAAAFLRGPLAFYLGAYGGLTSPCHDLLTAMALADPTIVRTRELPLAVDTGASAGWGATVVDRRERPGDWPRWRVALEVDVERFRELFRQLVAPAP